MDFDKIVANIPALLTYYVPGFLSYLIFARMTRAVRVGKTGFETGRVVPCIVISYLCILIANQLPLYQNSSEKWQEIIIIVIAITGSLIISAIWRMRWFAGAVKWLTRASVHSSIWDDVLVDELNRAKTVRFYTKYDGEDARIEGVVERHEVLEDGECWIAVKDYSVYYVGNDESGKPDYKGPEDACLIVRTKDIGTIESR